MYKIKSCLYIIISTCNVLNVSYFVTYIKPYFIFDHLYFTFRTIDTWKKMI